MKNTNKAQENENKLVAQRYAKALLDLSSDDISKENVLEELSDVTQSVTNSNDLNRVMNSPVISKEEKKNLLVKLFGENTSNTILNLLKLLVDKDRFNILESISKEYKNEVNKLNNLLNINITSAIDLTDSDKAMIKVKLEHILKKDIELDWSVNSDIIGGLVFEVGDNIIDTSLRHKLQEIRRNIIK
jgi:F-type H+-transporting ATPase subunit delta